MNRWRARLIWATVLSTLSIVGLSVFARLVLAHAADLKARNVRPSAFVKLAIFVSDFWQHHSFGLMPLIVLFWFGAVFVSGGLRELRQQALSPIGEGTSRPRATEE